MVLEKEGTAMQIQYQSTRKAVCQPKCVEGGVIDGMQRYICDRQRLVLW